MTTMRSWWKMASDKGALIVVLVLSILFLIGYLIEVIRRLSLRKAKECEKKFGENQ